MPTSMPGKCKSCWRPCLNRVDAGQRRCEECERSIAMLTAKRPKLELIREGARPKTLSYMLNDPDPAIAEAAAEALEND